MHITPVAVESQVLKLKVYFFSGTKWGQIYWLGPAGASSDEDHEDDESAGEPF